jgi:hypothetical protein
MNEITTTATQYADMLAVLLTEYGLSVLGGIVILIVGWTIAGGARSTAGWAGSSGSMRRCGTSWPAGCVI